MLSHTVVTNNKSGLGLPAGFPKMLIVRNALLAAFGHGVSERLSNDLGGEPRIIGTRTGGLTCWVSEKVMPEEGCHRHRFMEKTRWSDVPGLVISIDANGWKVRPDPLALAPVFMLKNDNRIEAISTSPVLLAALGDNKVDPLAIFEDILLGFRIGRRTVFSGIERLLPGEGLEIVGIGNDRKADILVEGGVKRDVERSESDDSDLRDSLASKVAQLFRDDFALELTAGVDSRLVLALGLAVDTKPRLAITIGTEDCADVLGARSICEHYGIQHCAIAPDRDSDTIRADSFEFVEQSGFVCNAASYGWLPNVFRRLKSKRLGQITGGGGELAGGFYYSPLDWIFAPAAMRGIWVKYRLAVPGYQAAKVFKTSAFGDLRESTTKEVRGSLDRGNGSWRERLDRFYQEERIRQWGAPVLVASMRWYGVGAPLLDDAYIQWARSLDTSRRAGRNGQKQLIRWLNNDLAEFPYTEQIRTAQRLNGSWNHRHQRFRKLMNRTLCRLGGVRRAQDPMAATAVHDLFQDQNLATELCEFSSDDSLGIDVRWISAMSAQPELFSHEIGCLLTDFYAFDRAKNIRRHLIEDRCSRGVHLHRLCQPTP